MYNKQITFEKENEIDFPENCTDRSVILLTLSEKEA